MNSKHFIKAGVLATILVLTGLVCWEAFWRVKGYEPTYNDDKALWALHRPNARLPMDEATVFIGSSRIKFDLDIPTWQKLTGEKAVQLAIVGTSPRLVLKDLAEDENFKGKLVIDITEPLFFSQNPIFHKFAEDALSFYKKQSLSEKLSSSVNRALESQLVFLEESRFSISTLLNDLEIPDRPGVFSYPAFPKGFQWTRFDRQTYMADLFLNDSNEINKQTNIWTRLISGDKTPPLEGDALNAVFEEVRLAVDKIRSRGGKVIFVRPPSSGPMGAGEKMAFPRDKYWDKILASAEAEGIHFSDYPETSGLICPEWSHLSPGQAKTYTRHLVKRLGERGWFASTAAHL